MIRLIYLKVTGYFTGYTIMTDRETRTIQNLNKEKIAEEKRNEKR